jgi:membrane-associated phospholipid phosphatase
MRELFYFIFTVLFLTQQVSAQKSDTLACDSTYRISYTQVIIPVTMVGVGFIGLGHNWFRKEDRIIRNELTENGTHHFPLDNYTQFVPAISVYGLNLCGIKGKHDYKDCTAVLVTASLLMEITVNSLKAITKEERPNGANRKSFPSGHTATAFMGAEFLWQEYNDVSPWIGIAGYTIAAGTGFLRLYNNQHWLTDVIAGAGIGILSTKAAYWLLPYIHKKLFTKKSFNMTAVPFASTRNIGINCSLIF